MKSYTFSKILLIAILLLNGRIINAQIITTFAGRNLHTFFSGGPATVTQLWNPGGIFITQNGMLYIADGTAAIREFNTYTDSLFTFAGTGTYGNSGDGGLAINARLFGPDEVIEDNIGNIIFADGNNQNVRKVTPTGTISTIAGNGIAGYSGDGGPATGAELNNPGGIAIDSIGNLFISDGIDNVIRKVTPLGIISTIAGNGSYGYSGDGGPALNAQLDNPDGIAIDKNGNLFVADYYNNVIRKITPSGIISTVAGNGIAGYNGDGGPATSAELYYPTGITIDKHGNLFIADQFNDIIRKVSISGIITTYAGNYALPVGYTGDGGPATSAELYNPNGLAIDTLGNLYISDCYNNVIRKVNSSGIINTVAGNRGNGGDGGPAAQAFLSSPYGVSSDQFGNIYITDTYSEIVRKVNSTGIISTIAGNGTWGYTGDGGLAINAAISSPVSVALDKYGNIYIADDQSACVRKIDHTTGIITMYAGNHTTGYSGDGGPATSAELYNPNCLAIDTLGNLYISDPSNNVIRKVTPLGIISTYAGNGIAGYAGDGGAATTAQLYFPMGLVLDSLDDLFIADNGNDVIRKVDKNTGKITTVAGNNSCNTGPAIGDGGSPLSASLCSPISLAIDGSGNLYIVCDGNYSTTGGASERVRKVTSTTNTTSTTAGRGVAGKIGDGGIPDSAYLNNPKGLCFDPSGNLYIADYGNMCVRKINYGTGGAGINKMNTRVTSIRLYPNPNNGVFSIEGIVPSEENSKIFTLEITNVMGQVVYNTTANAINDGIYIPVRLAYTLPGGVYFCHIAGSVTNVSLKFHLER